MREFELENLLRDAIGKASVGQKVVLNFKGCPQVIDVEMNFRGGWIVSQTIIPGRPFEFTKGEDGYLIGINMTVRPFEGIKGA